VKISNETLGILKNFASINSNIAVRPGNILKSVSPSKQIYAEATIPETFDKEFGVWDLNKFLSTLSLFKDPDLTFNDQFVRMSSGGTNAAVSYYYAAIALITPPVPLKFTPPPVSVEFTLSSKDCAELLKSAAVLQVSDLCIYSKDDAVYIKVVEKKESTSNFYEIKVSDKANGKNFNLNFKAESFKLIPGDYTVGLSERKVGQFKHKTLNLTYWIMGEKDSIWTA
jgi:hypothetical protein